MNRTRTIVSLLVCSLAPCAFPQSSSLSGVIPSATSIPFFYQYNGPTGATPDVLNSEAQLTNASQYRPVGSFATILLPLNIGLATQLSSLPIPSSASSILFREDPTTGASLPVSETLGPIFAERAETIGKGRFYIGYTRQQFRFNKMDGYDIGNLTLMYKGGDNTGLLQGGKPTVTSPELLGTQVAFQLDQNVVFMTYGLTNRIDVSVALPFEHASVGAIAFDAREINLGNPLEGGNCWCLQTLSVPGSLNTFNPAANQWGTGGFELASLRDRASGDATGIGDVTVRVKGTLIDTRSAVIAVGADLRTPSGDASNYLGAGAWGFKPYTAISFYTPVFGPHLVISPHLNFGYQVNGNSILTTMPSGFVPAGSGVASTTAPQIPSQFAKESRLPDQLSIVLGSEVAFTRNSTFSVDYLGQRVIGAYRLESASVTGPGVSTPVTGVVLSSGTESYTMNTLSVGVKFRLPGNLVGTANTLIALDHNGLRDNIVPMFGISYTTGHR